jgi:hypothetical protein
MPIDTLTARRNAGFLLWALLGGYLIFNRPFAGIGIPPLYVGEIVIAASVLALLPIFYAAFVEPLRHSWGFRLVAAFGSLCVLRGLLDAKTHGILALRDSVIGGYAIIAFLAPPLWAQTSRVNAAADSPYKNSLLNHAARIIQIISIPAAIWALALWLGVVNLSTVPSTKMDLVALSVAIAAWTSLMSAFAKREHAHKNERQFHFALQLACTIVFGALIVLFQNRTVWLSLAPMLALLAAAQAYTPRRKIFVGFAALASLVIVLFLCARLGRVFERLNTEFALNRELEFSIEQIEKDPNSVPLAKPDQPAVAPTTTLAPVTQGNGRLERLFSIFSPDDSQFQTTQGRLGADAVRWRAMFWLRCANYTFQHSPLFGIGFGTNLTLLLRNTPAWMYYIESQQVNPPNRNPHSAHVTIFTRLGVVGFLLWLSILGVTLITGIRYCWRMRREMVNAAPEISDVLSANYWAMLSVLGVWLLYVWAMTFGVVLENPFGGIWFWALTGVVLSVARRPASA